MWGTHEGKGPGWTWGCLAGQHLPQVPVALCWARCGEGSPSDMTQIIKNRTVGWWGGEAGEGDRAFPPGKAGGTKKKDFYVSSDSTFPWPGTAAPRAGPSAPHTLT